MRGEEKLRVGCRGGGQGVIGASHTGCPGKEDGGTESGGGGGGAWRVPGAW